ncbi:MAG: PD-(D/E)XK nuclease family protein, partial [Roseinatronobacter sp.]
GEAGETSDLALARGAQLHLLLEHLPLWPRETWDKAARDLLASTEEGAPADLAALVAEAMHVLETPDNAALFAPGTLAEVEITAELGGQPLFGVIDRLVVAEDHILAVDYKSNRLVPACADAVPEGLLRQMGAYRQALSQVFSGRDIRVALLWTADGALMDLPAALVDAALARAMLESGAREA